MDSSEDLTLIDRRYRTFIGKTTGIDELDQVNSTKRISIQGHYESSLAQRMSIHEE